MSWNFAETNTRFLCFQFVQHCFGDKSKTQRCASYSEKITCTLTKPLQSSHFPPCSSCVNCNYSRKYLVSWVSQQEDEKNKRNTLLLREPFPYVVGNTLSQIAVSPWVRQDWFNNVLFIKADPKKHFSDHTAAWERRKDAPPWKDSVFFE